MRQIVSSLDNETEKDFINCLKILNKKMTVLFVSHRELISAFKCNKIINLNKN